MTSATGDAARADSTTAEAGSEDLAWPARAARWSWARTGWRFAAGGLVGLCVGVLLTQDYDLNFGQLAVIIGDLAPVATLLAAGAAATVAWRTLKQKEAADRRAEWWRRAQWAVDKSTHEEGGARDVGQAAIRHLIASPLAENDESVMLRACSMTETATLPPVLPGRAGRAVDTATDRADNGGEGATREAADHE